MHIPQHNFSTTFLVTHQNYEKQTPILANFLGGEREREEKREKGLKKQPILAMTNMEGQYEQIR